MLLVMSTPVSPVGGGSILVGNRSVDWRSLAFLWWGYLAKTRLSVALSQCTTQVGDAPWILFRAVSSDTSARYRRVLVAALELCAAIRQSWREEGTQRRVLNDDKFFPFLQQNICESTCGFFFTSKISKKVQECKFSETFLNFVML